MGAMNNGAVLEYPAAKRPQLTDNIPLNQDKIHMTRIFAGMASSECNFYVASCSRCEISALLLTKLARSGAMIKEAALEYPPVKRPWLNRQQMRQSS